MLERSRVRTEFEEFRLFRRCRREVLRGRGGRGEAAFTREEEDEEEGTARDEDELARLESR
jgi:hypothetical protein